MSDFLKGLEGMGVTLVARAEFVNGKAVVTEAQDAKAGQQAANLLNALNSLSGPSPTNRPMPAEWNGVPPKTDFPASVTSVLKRLNAKTASGKYAVGDPELRAAKARLAQYWGVTKFVKPDGSNMKFSEIRGTNGGAIADNGGFVVTFTNDQGRGWIFDDLNVYTKPKFSASDMKEIKDHFSAK